MGKWTFYEDQKLKELYLSQNGYRKWKAISLKLRNFGIFKSPFQVRERYLNKLDPKLKDIPWKPTDVRKLFLFYEKHGSQWKNIQKQFQTRPQASLKNRFYITLRILMRYILTFKSFPKSRIKQKVSSTSFLTKVFEGKQQFQKSKGLLKQMLHSINYQTSKEKIQSVVEIYQDEVDNLYIAIMENDAGFKQSTLVSQQLKLQEEQKSDQQYQNQSLSDSKKICIEKKQKSLIKKNIQQKDYIEIKNKNTKFQNTNLCQDNNNGTLYYPIISEYQLEMNQSFFRYINEFPNFCSVFPLIQNVQYKIGMLVGWLNFWNLQNMNIEIENRQQICDEQTKKQEIFYKNEQKN